MSEIKRHKIKEDITQLGQDILQLLNEYDMSSLPSLSSIKNSLPNVPSIPTFKQFTEEQKKKPPSTVKRHQTDANIVCETSTDVNIDEEKECPDGWIWTSNWKLFTPSDSEGQKVWIRYREKTQSLMDQEMIENVYVDTIELNNYLLSATEEESKEVLRKSIVLKEVMNDINHVVKSTQGQNIQTVAETSKNTYETTRKAYDEIKRTDEQSSNCVIN